VGYFLSLLSALDHTRIFRLFFLSVVRIATSYRLIADGSDFESRECQEFSLLHVLQTGFRFHPTSYPKGGEGSSPGIKRSVYESDYLISASFEVMNMWI
jgi:hypothetical protein